LIKKLIGLSLIGLGIFLEILWLGICFGTLIIGILLLFLAPQILLLPLTLVSGLGIFLLKNTEKESSYRSGDYQQYYYENSYSKNSNYIKDDNMDKYYEILRSSPNDDFSTIKSNYHKLIKEYHYDTISSKNLPEEMLKFAEEKTKQLNNAYSKIKEVKS